MTKHQILFCFIFKSNGLFSENEFQHRIHDLNEMKKIHIEQYTALLFRSFDPEFQSIETIKTLFLYWKCTTRPSWFLTSWAYLEQDGSWSSTNWSSNSDCWVWWDQGWLGDGIWWNQTGWVHSWDVWHFSLNWLSWLNWFISNLMKMCKKCTVIYTSSGI